MTLENDFLELVSNIAEDTLIAPGHLSLGFLGDRGVNGSQQFEDSTETLVNLKFQFFPTGNLHDSILSGRSAIDFALETARAV